MTTRTPSMLSSFQQSEVAGTDLSRARLSRSDRAVLRRLRQVAMERRDEDVRAYIQIEKLSFDATNLCHAWQKNQKTALDPARASAGLIVRLPPSR